MEDNLVEASKNVLEKDPFNWQLASVLGVLAGDDVVVDVGTGNGKSLVFQLPLLLNKSDINLVVSPLTALMIDQV